MKDGKRILHSCSEAVSRFQAFLSEDKPRFARFVRRGCAVGMTVILLGAGIGCTAMRLSHSGLSDTIGTAAASTVLPSGGCNYRPAKASAPQQKSRDVKNSISQQIIVNFPHKENEDEKGNADTGDYEYSQPTVEELKLYDQEHSGEIQYPVLEFTSVQGDIAFAGIQVKNSASTELDIEEELKGRLGFKLEKNDKPQVLIYHTHTTEGFLSYDTGYYYESFYPRSTDSKKNVCAVGEEIVRQLKANGIPAIHDTTIHDDPSYKGAYYRSADTVREYLKKYPSIKVVIDIHRDGIGTECSRSKPVCMVNGRKAAQFMIMSGYNSEGDPAFDHWEYNLRLALQLQKNSVKLYPELARPLYFGDFVYNMDINTGSLLIEVGADSNTLEEVRYTGHLLGNVIAQTLRTSPQSG